MQKCLFSMKKSFLNANALRKCLYALPKKTLNLYMFSLDDTYVY